ncbi:MAG: hypothetical protein ACFB2X_01475 [Rivularia sp. (in: cyanobacteria)]
MTAQSKKRTDYLIEIGNNKVVLVKGLKSSMGAIASELGYTEDADGVVPDGKTLTGTGQEDALLNGCFPIAIYYKKNKSNRRAVLLVSPTKADTIANDLKGKKYAGNTITRVLPVRRRKYTFY